MKKFLLALCLLMGYATLHAAGGIVVDGWTYRVSSGEAQIYGRYNSYNNTYIPVIPESTSGAITIPATLGGYPVTSIGDGAFYRCSSLTSVLIPSSVTAIGSSAFSGCTGLTSVTIPSSVTSIGSSAFSGCSNLTSVTIPYSVTFIGPYAFNGVAPETLTAVEKPSGGMSFNNLKTVIIPKGVITIVEDAFYGCSRLTSVTIPEGVTSIGNDAFYDCSSLTSVTIPYSVTSIGGGAFYNCKSLTSVTIPSSVTSIGYYAFSGCSSLISFVVDSANQHYSAKNGLLYSKDGKTLVACPGGLTSLTIPEGVTTIGGCAFAGCSSLTSVTIPSSVTSIGYGVFDGCTRLTSVTIPDSVTSIGGYAFEGCSGLATVTIPASVTSIGSNAFNGVAPETLTAVEKPSGGMSFNNLKTVIIPEGVTSIGSSAFYDCSRLTSVTIPSSVTSIGNMAFYRCECLTSVTIPSSVTSIGNMAFIYCHSLTSVTIPLSVTSIGNYAFSGCSSLTSFVVDSANQHYSAKNGLLCSKDGKTLVACPGGLTSVTIPSSVTSIGNYAFEDCSSLTSVTIPEGVTSIGERAFAHCSSLTSVTIPSSVTSIGNRAFYSCHSLTSVTIPEGVTTIGDNAFENCSSLTSVTIPSSVTTIGRGAFSNCDSLTSFVVDSANQHYSAKNGLLCSKDGKTLVRCPDGLTSVTIPEGVTTIGEYAFSSCSSLTSVTIPNSVTSIGEGAFWGCSSLTSVTILEGVISIGDSAFRYCSSLTSVTIPSSVTSIGNYAFYGCSCLTSVTIPSSVIEIGKEAFHDEVSIILTAASIPNGMPKTSIKTLIIPSNVTSIGNSAFSGCFGLTSVTIPSSVTSIGSFAFSVCKSLTSVTIPEGVTTIGEGAFSGCTGLTSVTIPEGVTSIGEDAFSGCSSLTSVTIPEGVTTIGDNAFENCSSLTSLRIPEGVTTIGGGAFSGCTGLTSVTIPSSVTTIGGGAFSGCSMLYRNENGVQYESSNMVVLIDVPTSRTGIFIIPNSVRFISASAFFGCKSLTSVTIPEGVTSIGDYTFYDCTRLTSVTIPSSVTSIGEMAFDNCSALYEDENGVQYESSNKVILIDVPTSLTGEFIIPNSVRFIYSRAFNSCDKLTSVTIPSSVTSIGYGAFDGCTRLTSVHISDLAAWSAINFTSNPWSYAKNLYLNNELVTDLVLPLSVTKIESNAFSGCMGLTSVTIPSSVTTIGYRAFAGCSNIVSIEIPSRETTVYYSAFEGVKPERLTVSGKGLGGGIHCDSVKELNISEGETSIDSRAFYGYYNLSSVTIPTSVIEIGEDAFLNVKPIKLTAVELPYPMSYERLTTVIVPIGATKVDEYAFNSCKSLTSVTIPEGVTFIGDSAFSGCKSLTFVAIPEGVTSIGESAFSECSSLTSVTIPSSVTSIGDSAFSGCKSLTSVTIPEGVTTIGSYAFSGCESLTSLTIPEGVTSIRYRSFAGCLSLTSVTIPSSVTTIGEDAFAGCSNLTSVTFKGNPPSIEDSVFDDVKNFVGYYFSAHAINWEEAIDANGKWHKISMLLKDGVNRPLIKFDANGGQGGTEETLKSGDVLIAPVVTRDEYFFVGWEPEVPQKVPARNVTYVAQWKKYSEVLDCSISNGKIRIVGCDPSISGEFKIPSTIEGKQVVAIEDEAFAYCTNLISIVIPSSVTTIGEDAFAYCESLTSVTIPSSVTSIGKRAFQGCRSITSLLIPANVKVLREGVFEGCSELTSLTLSEGVTQLDFSAFAFCEGLTSVNLPSSLTKMSYSVFSFCSNLLNINVDSKNKTFKSIDGVVYNTDGTTLITVPAGRSEYEIPYGIKEIGPGAFCGNDFVTSVSIPNTVTKIGRAAFSGCAQLESIEFPDKLSQIETGMLYGSYSIKTIKIPSSVTYVKSYALQCEAGEIWFGGKPPTVEKLDAFVDVTGTLETSTIGYYPSTYADAWKRVIVNGKWNCLTMKMYTPVATVTLIFNANGGVGGTTVKQAAGTTLTAPTVTRTGYTFTGWSPAVPTKTPAQNVTYTAQWKKNTEQPDIGGGDNPHPEEMLDVTYKRSGKKVIVTGKKSDFKGEALTIPAMIEGCPVTEIAKDAFKGDTVLTAVTISEGVTTIGADAFKGCTTLDPAQVTLPSTLKKMGKGAFTGCKVTEVSAVPGEPLTSQQLGKAAGYKVATSASGLKLNAKTGDITATFKKSGTYEAVLFKPGAILKALRIKVGAMPKLTIKMDGADAGCSVKGEGSYLMGKKVSLSAKASKEKIFLGFYDAQGKQLTSAMKYSHVMGREDVTLTAKFTVEQITINTSALTSKTWKVGETVNVTIPVTAESGVKSVKAAKLPSGLKLSKTKDNRWQVTGSPKKMGNYTVTFTVGTNQKKQKAVTITMKVIAETVTINTSAVKNKTLNVGQAASGLTIGATATSGIKSVKASKLPSGMKVQLVNGVWQLTGAPKKAGTYTVTLTITTKVNTKITETFTLTVALLPDWAVKTFSGEVVSVWEEDDGEVEMYGYAQITVLATGEVKGRVSLNDGAFATLSGTAKLLESTTTKVRLQVTVPWFDAYGKADGKVKTDLVIQKTGQGVTLSYLDVAKDSSVTGTLR